MSSATANARAFGPLSTAQPNDGAALWLLGAFMLLCLVQFSNAWYWPVRPEFGDLAAPRFEKVYGVPFQYAMWCLISLAVGLHLLRTGAARLLDVLLPWAPFWLLGVVAGLLGFDPSASLRYSVFWLAMASSAVVAGSALSPQRSLDALRGSLVIILAASILVALLLPKAGTQLYGTAHVWSGVFVSKNQLGWVAALALMLGVQGVLQRSSTTLSGWLLLLALACLAGAQSKGSFVAAAAGVGYLLLLAGLAKRFTEGLSAMLAVGLALCSLVFVKLVMPMVLDVLGRDATLTGRTDIWDVYFGAMLKTPWLGQGPGAFTGTSPITEKLARMLSDLGGIYTPHNMFLGAFGDAGVLGLAAFCGALLWIGVVVPIRHGTLLSKALAGICVVTVVGGMVEAHEVYSAGVGGFLLVVVHAIVIRQHRNPTAPERAARP